MDEFKNLNNDEMNNEAVNSDVENVEGEIVEKADEAEKSEWFMDDFESTVKNRVPKGKQIAVYQPKSKKKHTGFFASPVFAGIASSVITCAICLSAFYYGVMPSNTEREKQTALNSISGTQSAAASSEYKNMLNSIDALYASGELTIPQIYEKSSPAVVSIICISSSSSYVQSNDVMSSGSGIIFSKDGYIATNNHVIEGANKITVKTIAGQSFEAKLIGTDSKTDLAVIKIESDTELPYAEFGDSSEIKVGELAVAIGNPLKEELASTLTVGIISAINRSIMIDGKQMTMLQTDAAINPGNSGGALLNGKGQVIGINTAKSSGYDIEGLGFAIPINEAKPILESIIKDGYVTGRPLIGIVGIDVTDQIAKANNLPIGVYIKQISEFSAAERAGLKVGDVILSCQDKQVKTVDELNKIRDEYKAGDVIKMKISRNGQKMDVELTLLEEKPETQQQKKQQQQDDSQQYQVPDTQIPDIFSWFGW